LLYSGKAPEDSGVFGDMGDSIEATMVDQTKARIAVGRQETQSRVRPHMESMSAYLDSFETAGDG